MRTLAATLAALALTTPASGAAADPPKLSPVLVAYWTRLHLCEQPSTWFHPGPTYPGGLGIYWPNWVAATRALGLAGRYPSAASAPPGVQMAVADFGYRRWRWWWGCFRTIGTPPPR